MITRKWQCYPSYKDSGVEWLGEVPEGWDVKKLKYIGKAIIGLTYSPSDITDEQEGTLVLRSSNLQNGRIKLDDNVFVKMKIPISLRTREKDILICSRNGSRSLIGKNALIEKEATGISFGAFTTVFRSQYNNFLFYIFNSNIFLYQSGLFVTSTINQLTTSMLNNFEVALPPLPEQEQIAQFLDRETAKIDLLIAKKERLIELLKEKRTALISHAVTKGLNPDAPMKDSGVEWLGEVPRNWPMIRLKYVAPVSSAKLTQKPDDLPYLGLEHIESKTGRLLLETPVESVESTVSCFEEGDVLFGKLRPYLAKVLLADFKGVSTTELLALKPSQHTKGKFLFYQLIAEGFIDQVNSLTYGTKMPRVSPEQITNFFIPLPPLSEQKQIAQFLDRETAKIDNLITKTKTSIDYLKEYRTALISAAVTGKIDVR
jgi:restriction endonuclease S subunit